MNRSSLRGIRRSAVLSVSPRWNSESPYLVLSLRTWPSKSTYESLNCDIDDARYAVDFYRAVD